MEWCFNMHGPNVINNDQIKFFVYSRDEIKSHPVTWAVALRLLSHGVIKAQCMDTSKGLISVARTLKM